MPKIDEVLDKFETERNKVAKERYERERVLEQKLRDFTKNISYPKLLPGSRLWRCAKQPLTFPPVPADFGIRPIPEDREEARALDIELICPTDQNYLVKATGSWVESTSWVVVGAQHLHTMVVFLDELPEADWTCLEVLYVIQREGNNRISVKAKPGTATHEEWLASFGWTKELYELYRPRCTQFVRPERKTP